MFFRDKRFIPFIFTTLFILLNCVVFTICQFDSDYSLFGENLTSNMISKLSYNSSEPFSLFGIKLLTSIFTHQNLSHLLVNLLFFGVISFSTERYLKKFEYIITIFLIHTLSLLTLTLFISEEHLFLGSSIVCFGLLNFHAMILKRYYLFILGPTFISISLIFSSTDWYSAVSHILGMIFGVIIYLIFTNLLGRRYKTN